MWKRTAAKKKPTRKLRSDERERVQDTMHLVQSARETLSEIDPRLVPEKAEIEECFDLADRSLRASLRSA